MLNIDEVIAHARKNYNDIINTTYNKCQDEHRSCDGCATPTCKEIADENLQIAEWLELLKWYEQGMEDIPCESGVLPKDVYSSGYIKAIDDLMEKASECSISCADWYYLGQVAKQLKEGATSEADNQ